MTKTTEIIFTIAILMHLFSYGAPFIREEFGLYFFIEGIEALIDGNIDYGNFNVFFAFFAPILSLPFLLVAAWKAKNPKSPRISYGLFFFFEVFPVLLSFYTIINRGGPTDGYLGYGLWAISLLLLYWVYIQRTKKRS